MHKLLLILSLLAIVLQTLSLPFLAFRLETKRESEAIPMCVNRDQPELACFGSCYINKHLTEALAQEKADNDASIFTVLQAQPLISSHYPSLHESLSVPLKQKTCFAISSWSTTLMIRGIWHPPQA